MNTWSTVTSLCRKLPNHQLKHWLKCIDSTWIPEHHISWIQRTDEGDGGKLKITLNVNYEEWIRWFQQNVNSINTANVTMNWFITMRHVNNYKKFNLLKKKLKQQSMTDKRQMFLFSTFKPDLFIHIVSMVLH